MILIFENESSAGLVQCSLIMERNYFISFNFILILKYISKKKNQKKKTRKALLIATSAETNEL